MIFYSYTIILIINHQLVPVPISSSGDICLSLGIPLSNPMLFVPLSTLSQLFWGKRPESFVILSAILLLIKSPAAPAVLWIPLFKAILSLSVGDCLALSRIFWLYLLLKILLNFLPIFLSTFLVKNKNP